MGAKTSRWKFEEKKNTWSQSISTDYWFISEGNVAVKKSGGHHLKQVIKVSIINKGTNWHHVRIPMWCAEEHTRSPLCSARSITESNHEKTTGRARQKDILQNNGPVFFKSVNCHYTQQGCRTNCSRVKEAEETWRLQVMHDPGLHPESALSWSVLPWNAFFTCLPGYRSPLIFLLPRRLFLLSSLFDL